MGSGLHVAIVGMNFGASFVPSYKFHPMVEKITICDLDRQLLNRVGQNWAVDSRKSSLQDVLDDPDIDAVHILTDIPRHVEHSVAVLEAGKHCICAVPMSLDEQGVEQILRAAEKSGKVYLLAETVIFARNFLYVADLIQSGRFGNIQFTRGAHYQDMDGWPAYWRGLPPMYYATHALAPAFAATNSHAERVVCFGSGHMRQDLHKPYGNPFPMQTALFEMGKGTLAEVTRTLFHNPRGYTEAFTIGGELMTFETGQLDSDLPVLWEYIDKGDFDPFMKLEKYTTMGRQVTEQRIDPPDQLENIPSELWKFTRSASFTAADGSGAAFDYLTIGGFHPHLVHEFVMAVHGKREPTFSTQGAAALTFACFAAHQSALNGGKEIIIRQP